MLFSHSKNTFLSHLSMALVHRMTIWEQSLRYLCWNAGYRLAGASDGLPIPPTHLVKLVSPLGELAWFLRGGKTGQECILYALRRNGFSIQDFRTILDFGCGCGRIMRHWKTCQGPRFYGTDYNPVLIDWCQKNLGDFAQFNTNQLNPPLEYEDGFFDFIYVFSVFTHLTEDLQHAWIRELGRVLKAGGLLLITVHGCSRLVVLSPEEQSKFLAGQLVMKQEAAVGTNICGSYHPENYVRNHLAKSFEVVDFMDAGARDLNQDIYLLRK